MANLAKWNTTSTQAEVTIMSTTLASVASSSLSAASTTITINSSGLRIYSDWELVVGTTVGAFGVGAAAVAYVVPTMDGTNYVEEDKAELEPMAIFPLTTSTANAQHRVVRRMVSISPLDFKVVVLNQTTQSWTTGGGANTLKMLPYDVNLNA